MAQSKPSIVTYKELLRRAHEAGLQSIFTELVQVPDERNAGIAISRATITLEKDGQTRTFQAVGDAAKNNVSPAMQTCLMRMSETRAKARALRDAVNIGEVSAEEMAEFDEAAPSRHSRPAATNAGQPPINDTGTACPYCHAPNLKPHVRTCPTLKQTAQAA